MAGNIGGSYTQTFIADTSGYKTDPLIQQNNKYAGSIDDVAAHWKNAGAMSELYWAKELANISKASAQRRKIGVIEGMSAAGARQTPGGTIPGMIGAHAENEAALQRRNAAEATAAAERKAIRDNEHNQIMAGIQREQAFRDAVRARYLQQDRADTEERARLRVANMTSLMGDSAGRVGSMTGGMSASAAQSVAAQQAADQAMRTSRARVLDFKQQARAQDEAAERASIERLAAAQATADQEARTRRARQLDIKQSQREADLAADRAAVERLAAAQATADQEARTRRARVLDQKQKDREADLAADRAAIARATAQARSNIATIRGSGAAGMMTGIMGPMPAQMNQAQQAIARMRADLQPMVGMEMRLAEEAREFRNYIQQAVTAQGMSLAEARLLTTEFREQQDLLRQRAAREQGGFLGTRRFGFAAQQLGYGIEDAASQYGTMGIAGAFRAGSNNLTAMAAVMGPMVGVTASLTAAALSLGIQWFENKKKIAENTEEAKKLKSVTDNIASAVEFQISLQRQLTDARKADHSTITQMMEANKRQIEALEDEIKKRNAIKKQADDMAIVNELLTRNSEARTKLQLNLQMGPFPGEKEAQAHLAAMKLLNEEQEDLLKWKKELVDEAANAVGQEQKIVDIQKQQKEMQKEQNRAMRKEAEDRMAREGVEAKRSAEGSITSRYESLNPELKIQNEILDARIKLNEQINIGLRAGQISVDQSKKYRDDFERVVQLEAEQRAGEKNLKALSKQEKDLIDSTKGNSAAVVAGAVKRGSDEANKIIESEKLRRANAKDNEPVVAQLRLILKATEDQKAALEAIAANIPQVATVP